MTCISWFIHKINVLNVNYGMVLIKIKIVKITLLSKHFREFVEETRLGHFIMNCINIAYIINIAFDLVTCFVIVIISLHFELNIEKVHWSWSEIKGRCTGAVHLHLGINLFDDFFYLNTLKQDVKNHNISVILFMYIQDQFAHKGMQCLFLITSNMNMITNTNKHI